LTLAALAWGFVNFGVLLWLPGALVDEGRGMGLAATIIAKSTLFAVPTVAAVAWLYSVWSTKWSLVTMLAITTLGLLAVLLRGLGTPSLLSGPILPLVLLIIGSTGVISIILPYTAENYPIRLRGRATGWVAGCSKLGGLIARGLSVLALVPVLDIAALTIAAPAGLSLLLIAFLGRETRKRDLRELEAS
jgi:putative MFS transporter